MARLPRLSLAGHLHHVVQRGNNGQPVCISTADYRQLLEVLEDSARTFRVAVHGYVLMGDHFHLLVTPEDEHGVSRMMQAIGRRYVRYFNKVSQRRGTLWEGRYRSTLMEPERHLLPCMAYLDLKPVRDGLVSQARDYPWSSHGHYAGLRTERLISAHALYWALGNTPFAREAAYVALLQSGVSEREQRELVNAVQFGWALGSGDFIAALQKQTGRRVSRATVGRPRTKPRTGPDEAVS